MEWRRKLAKGVVTELSEVELAELLAAADVLREEDTKISGLIRVLVVDGLTVVQEQTPKQRYLARVVENVDSASRFVEERLDTYDRMWDGCGCKVDYSS